MKKEIGIGFFVGIIATFFGFFLYINFFSKFDFETTLSYIIDGNLVGKLLGLAALPNLFVFFVYLKKKQDYRAKGVVFASLLIAFLVMLAQFL